MSHATDLARPTLDTLPLNLAVLAPNGTILLTNRAWDEFATSEGNVEDPDELGRNYLAATEGVDDEHARRADEGIRAVLAGERDQYLLEYPCHSPDERRWFMMRARPLEVDGRRHAVVAHLDITDRKLAETAAEDRAAQLEHVLERINGLVSDVTAGVAHARSRAAAESVACEEFVASPPYRFAWIGRPDLRTEQLVAREWAGDAPADVTDRTVAIDGDHPTAVAYRSGEVQVDDDIRSRVPEPVRDWVSAAAAVPFRYRSKTYGVLTVYADDADAFDERERAVLTAMGRTVGTAIHALTTGRVLSTSSVVEVELSVENPDAYLADLTAGTGATVTQEDSMLADDGTLLLYATVTGADAETVHERARDHADVTDVGVLTETADRLLVEVGLRNSLPATVADHEGMITALSAANGRIDLTTTFPDEVTARTAFDHLEERYEGVELTGYREREREPDTVDGFRETVEAALTERQLTALRTAYLSGYFEWPRPVSGDEVAESMDITRATFHQHLREAQRKLATVFFDAVVPE